MVSGWLYIWWKRWNSYYKLLLVYTQDNSIYYYTIDKRWFKVNIFLVIVYKIQITLGEVVIKINIYICTYSTYLYTYIKIYNIINIKTEVNIQYNNNGTYFFFRLKIGGVYNIAGT